MKYLKTGIAWTLLSCSVVAAQRTNLTLGVYTSDKASTMAQKYAPFVKWMSGQLSRERDRVQVELRIFSSYKDALRALVDDRVDFVRFGAASYVLASQRNPRVQLLAVENKRSKKTFKGLIVVPTKSPIAKLADLRGKTFAFGDRNSTIGRFLAQEALLSAGIDATRLRKHAFLGRHDTVFRAVQLGDFHAGAVKSGTYRKLNKAKQLRIIARYDAPTKPWVARSKLDRKMVERLRQTLLGMRDPKMLKILKVQGFLPTGPKDFASLRLSMRVAIRFDAAQPKPPK